MDDDWLAFWLAVVITLLLLLATGGALVRLMDH